eukprot:259449-Prymnesium_polylepis.1
MQSGGQRDKGVVGESRGGRERRRVRPLGGASKVELGVRVWATLAQDDGRSFAREIITVRGRGPRTRPYGVRTFWCTDSARTRL